MTPCLLDVNPVSALHGNHEGHPKNVSPATGLYRKTKGPAHKEKMGKRTPGLSTCQILGTFERTGQLGAPRSPVHRLGTGLANPADALSSYQSDARPSDQQIVIESELLAAIRSKSARVRAILRSCADPESASFAPRFGLKTANSSLGAISLGPPIIALDSPLPSRHVTRGSGLSNGREPRVLSVQA